MKSTLFAVIAVVSLWGCATSSPDPAGDNPVASETPPAAPAPRSGDRIGGHTPREIIAMFGARLRDGVSDRQLGNYRRVFGFGDTDRDGRHSRREYVDEGRYMTRQARQGIFRAADFDKDGFVSRAEYVNNRIITDEAKEIFDDMDASSDRRLTLDEMIGSGKLKDQELARAVFRALDTDGNGALIIPEYLRVWGRWARSKAPQAPR
ncbi:MAG: hypothetical protein CMJ90_04420 [Planctomycetes bacterium]|nr:hypothetical protein [Planctomycetota bacterium]